METYNTVYPRRKNYEKNQVYVVAKGVFAGTTLIIRIARCKVDGPVRSPMLTQ